MAKKGQFVNVSTLGTFLDACLRSSQVRFVQVPGMVECVPPTTVAKLFTDVKRALKQNQPDNPFIVRRTAGASAAIAGDSNSWMLVGMLIDVDGIKLLMREVTIAPGSGGD
jgi:hypothetical protein